MYKNQFIKILNEQLGHSGLYCIGAGDMSREIAEQAKILTHNLPDLPCFYLGDILTTDLDHDLPFIHIENDRRLLWEGAFDHLPFQGMCICARLPSKLSTGETGATKVLINLQQVDDMQRTAKGEIKEWCINTVLTLWEGQITKFIYFPLTVTVAAKMDRGHLCLNYYLDTATGIPDVQVPVIDQTAQVALNITCYMLKLLSCKNAVVVRESAGGRAPSAKRPELNYNTIRIKLTPSQRFVYRGKEIDEVPFHEREKYGLDGTCRGHFKTYTEDAPLFGKHVGTWWWSPRFNTHRRRDYELVR